MHLCASLIPFIYFVAKSQFRKSAGMYEYPKYVVSLSSLHAETLSLNCRIWLKYSVFLCSEDDKDICPCRWPVVTKKTTGRGKWR